MKVYCEYNPNDSGKGKFLTRLLPAIKKYGISLECTPDGCDVAFGFTRWRSDFPPMPKVLRVDGIYYHKTKHNLWNNKRVGNSIKKADHIIYQSDFNRYMVENLLRVGKKSSVIFNGANPGDYKEAVKSPFKKNIIMSAKWKARDNRDYKRLHETVDALRPCLGDACLWIAGQTAEQHEDESNIKWLGRLPEKELAKYLKMADIMVQFSRYSSCDNAVIEAVCAGCQIVTSNIGGNAEISKACNGYIINTDVPMYPKFYPEKMPEPDFSQLKTVLTSALECPKKINNEPVHINNIAKKYAEVFSSVHSRCS